jgi:predicted lipid carrier protein YhbT
MMALRGPVEATLARALRRIARGQPEAFDRLAGFQNAVFLVAPTGWPVAFALSPRPNGAVRVVRADAPGTFAARIEGRLEDLLGLFDGRLDADSAFFNRLIQVEGDTAAVVALHNALEAADLSLADLLGSPLSARAAEKALEVMRFASLRNQRAEAWR